MKMNDVNLIGRTTKDPELKYIAGSGQAVVNITIAINRYSKDTEQKADFIPIVIYGKQAESTATYVSKGKLIGISGSIRTRNYENNDGNKVYVTEVIARSVEFLEWADGGKKEDKDIFDDAQPMIDDGDIPF